MEKEAMTFFWSSQSLTYFTIGLNVAKHSLDVWRMFHGTGIEHDQLFSICGNSSLTAMIHSMFSRADSYHLLSNMIHLLITSRSLFIDHSERWSSPWAFIWIYVPSGIAALAGEALLFRILQNSWFEKNDDQLVAFIMDAISDCWAVAINGGVPLNPLSIISARWRILQLTRDESLKQWNVLSKKLTSVHMGASGAVFGLFGARAYTALCSSCHPGVNASDFQLLHQVASDFLLTPRSLKALTYFESCIGHAAHLGGFASGFVSAWI